MATQLVLVNRILRRMREDTISVTTASNSAVIVAEMVADAYEEVLDAHAWEALKHVVGVDLVSGKTQYDLSRYAAASGDITDTTGRLPDVESELQWMNGDYPQVYLYRTDARNEKQTVLFLSPEAFREIKSRDYDSTESLPAYFTIYPLSTAPSTERLYMEVYPEPTGSSYMELTFWTRPPTLEADGTTDGTNILIPERPVFQLALMYAINERGEELGEPGNLSERRYYDSLGAAIERDIAIGQRGDRYEWRRD